MVFWLGIVSLAVFYLLIIGVGIWAAKKSKAPLEGESECENLMLAGRDIGLVVGIFTMTATWVGGGYINGTAENVFTPGQGLIWCQAPVGYALSLIMGGIFFAGKMRAQGHVTMLDPFQKKFGERMGGLLFIPALMGEIFWSAAILSALGATITVILNVGDDIAVILSSIIAVAYTMFGGLYAVAYTDVVQLFCIFVGLWLAVPFAMMNKNVESIAKTSSRWMGSAIPNEKIAIYIDSALMLVMGGIPWQVYFQRVLSSRSARRAQVLSFLASFGCLIMALPAVLLGAVAASTDWNATKFKLVVNNTLNESQYKNVLPLVMHYLCPEWVAFIGLGAVSAAVMSSADSSILSAASMFARNVVKSIFWQTASDKQIIWIMRISVFFIGALACLMGIKIKSIYELWYLCSDLVYVIIFPQLVCVVYFDRSNTYGSLVGYIIGFLFRLSAGESTIGFPALIKFPFYDQEQNLQLFPYKTFSMFISLIFIIIVSLATDYMFKSGKWSKEKDIFECVVNMKPIQGQLNAEDEDGTVINHILAKRMSFKKYPQTSQDSQSSVNYRNSIKLNQTALELISSAKEISEQEEKSTFVQDSPNKEIPDKNK
uniref:Slc5a-5 n=1 Tax=Schmidtea mediterranea TaxID=79327 RepID=A0A0H3YEX2_SCHMD|nr:slc5a-5 [Schmidtea mediterranea]